MVAPFHHIGIIGAGLIGGSIYKGLKEKEKGLHLTLFPYPIGEAEFNTHLLDLDLLIIATPLSEILTTARRIRRASCPLTIMDVGSVKEPIVSEFEHLTGGTLEFIGTHPMAGKEKGGYENSEANLFLKRPWAITPHKKNSPETLKKISALIELLEAKPVLLSPKEHDAYAALVSHIPGLIARKYDEFLKEIAPDALKLAGPGYDSFSRLARDNPVMRKEIEAMNQTSIDHFFTLWKKTL